MDKNIGEYIANISNHLQHLEVLVESMEKVLSDTSQTGGSIYTCQKAAISLDIDLITAVQYVVQKLPAQKILKVDYQIDLMQSSQTISQDVQVVFCVLRVICLQIMKKSQAEHLLILVTERKSILSIEINYSNLRQPLPLLTSREPLVQIESYLNQRQGELDIYSDKRNVFFTIVLPLPELEFG